MLRFCVFSAVNFVLRVNIVLAIAALKMIFGQREVRLAVRLAFGLSQRSRQLIFLRPHSINRVDWDFLYGQVGDNRVDVRVAFVRHFAEDSGD